MLTTMHKETEYRQDTPTDKQQLCCGSPTWIHSHLSV